MRPSSDWPLAVVILVAAIVGVVAVLVLGYVATVQTTLGG